MTQTLLFDTAFSREQAHGLAWEVETHHFGCLLGAKMDLTPQHILRGAASFARGEVSHLMIDVIISGGLRGKAEGRDFVARANDLLIYDLAQVSLTIIDEPTLLVSWIVPRTMFGEQRDPASLHGLVLEHGSPVARLLGSHLRELMNCSPLLSKSEVQAFGEATAALLGRALAPFHSSEPGPDCGTALLTRLCMYIERSLALQDLSPTLLCKQFGVSRTVLYRLFEPVGGVAGYIRRRRLLNARKRLLDPQAKHLQVSQIAHMHGLDPNTFSRVFTQAFGMTPREARNLGLSAVLLPSSESDAPEQAHLDWFRML